MHETLLLLAAFVAGVAGMGWLALSLDVHWRQVQGESPRRFATATRLQVQGTAGLVVSLAPCLAVDHAFMAALVWIMMLTASALVIATTLAWRAHWLQVLVPRQVVSK